MILEIKDLNVETAGKPILKDLSLQVNPGEIHAIMGPNGAGKSTLAKVAAGHPHYEVTGGDILLEGNSLLEVEPDARSHLGLFVSFQYPLEIPGVSNFDFLYSAYEARQKNPLSREEFKEHVLNVAKELHIKADFLDRDLNSGFSGGEKKRNEILQMAVLQPKCAILDETDSGLDIDALRIVARGVQNQMTEEKGLILITHYQRLLDYIKPDFVHVMIDGKIVETGGADLALKLEERGYDLARKA